MHLTLSTCAGLGGQAQMPSLQFGSINVGELQTKFGQAPGQGQPTPVSQAAYLVSASKRPPDKGYMRALFGSGIAVGQA